MSTFAVSKDNHNKSNSYNYEDKIIFPFHGNGSDIAITRL